MKSHFYRRTFLCSSVIGLGTVSLWTSTRAASDSAMSAAPVSALNWVPEKNGDVKVVLTGNTFLSQNGKLAGWAQAFGKIVDDFSGGVFNPYWGPLGAMVFHGGGHSATFDNSVVILDLNDLMFKRLSNPTPSNNGANWAVSTQASKDVDPAFNSTYCEYGDGQPGAGHTYDTLAILPPADGGARFGSLIRVSSHAVHAKMSRDTGWAHRFDFQSTSMHDGKWVRWSVNGPTKTLSPGASSAYDTRRKRFWWICSLSSAPPMIRYLDVAKQQQMEIRYSSVARTAPAANPDSVTMRYEPKRDILVLTCTVNGKLVLAYLRCESPELGWFLSPMSQSIPATPGWSHPFDSVPEADKFVLLTQADKSALYDISLQNDPTLMWSVVRRPLRGASIPTAYVAGKRWSYAPSVKSFVWMASSTSEVIAYRPFGL